MPLWRGDRLASATVDLVCVCVCACMCMSVSFKKIHDDHTKVLMAQTMPLPQQGMENWVEG